MAGMGGGERGGRPPGGHGEAELCGSHLAPLAHKQQEDRTVFSQLLQDTQVKILTHGEVVFFLKKACQCCIHSSWLRLHTHTGTEMEKRSR